MQLALQTNFVEMECTIILFPFEFKYMLEKKKLFNRFILKAAGKHDGYPSNVL